jgi:hypothetical protein
MPCAGLQFIPWPLFAQSGVTRGRVFLKTGGRHLQQHFRGVGGILRLLSLESLGGMRAMV